MLIHPQQGNALVPEGEYDGWLARTKETASADGTPMLLAEFEIFNGAPGARVSMFLLDGGFRDRWESFLAACAPPAVLESYRTQRETDVDPNLWVGAKVRLQVAHATRKGKLYADVTALARRTADHPLDPDATIPF